MSTEELQDSCLGLVFRACYRLQLDMEATASAVSIFHRYASGSPDFNNSLSDEDVKLLVSTVLFLASKTEETPRRLRDVLSVTHRLTWTVGDTGSFASSPLPVGEQCNGECEEEMTIASSSAATNEDEYGGLLNLDHEYLRLKERVVHMEQKASSRAFHTALLKNALVAHSCAVFPHPGVGTLTLASSRCCESWPSTWNSPRRSGCCCTSPVSCGGLPRV